MEIAHLWVEQLLVGGALTIAQYLFDLLNKITVCRKSINYSLICDLIGKKIHAALKILNKQLDII